jgi:multidrug efflux pump subunit AcrA (membrane-fusion protein)
VLRVPVSAVHGEPGGYFCFVESTNSYERRPISIGVASETHVEIASGLQSGETVLLGSPPKSEIAAE